MPSLYATEKSDHEGNGSTDNNDRLRYSAGGRFLYQQFKTIGGRKK